MHISLFPVPYNIEAVTIPILKSSIDSTTIFSASAKVLMEAILYVHFPCPSTPLLVYIWCLFLVV